MTTATVLNSSGSGFTVTNAVLNSSGTSFAVDNYALDSDGNSFLIFTGVTQFLNTGGGASRGDREDRRILTKAQQEEAFVMDFIKDYMDRII